MIELNLVYKKSKFPDININPVMYCDDFFQSEIDLESDIFYELRKKNGFIPFRIKDSSKEELDKIKLFFNKNKETFYFLFNDKELIGSILFIGNYIQSLSINRKYQKMGYGSKLTQCAVNKILSQNYSEVTLKVMGDNIPALHLYKKLGFEVTG